MIPKALVRWPPLYPLCRRLQQHLAPCTAMLCVYIEANDSRYSFSLPQVSILVRFCQWIIVAGATAPPAFALHLVTKRSVEHVPCPLLSLQMNMQLVLL